jgi:hypothetical protein
MTPLILNAFWLQDGVPDLFVAFCFLLLFCKFDGYCDKSFIFQIWAVKYAYMVLILTLVCSFGGRSYSGFSKLRNSAWRKLSLTFSNRIVMARSEIRLELSLVSSTATQGMSLDCNWRRRRTRRRRKRKFLCRPFSPYCGLQNLGVLIPFPFKCQSYIFPS